MFNDLSQARHCFEVRAVDPAGNRSSPASYCWTVVLDGGFPISGLIDAPFHPGVTRPVNLVIGNPNNFAVQVVAVTITVDQQTTKPGCAGDENLVVSRGLLQAVDVPANTTASLEDLGVDRAQWPELRMPNLASNQDACKGAEFTLHYTAQATKP